MKKKDPKKAEQKKLEGLTPRERMDMEKCLNWLFRVYQEKKSKGEKLD